MRKRILSVGLSIAMLLSLLPGTALAMETEDEIADVTVETSVETYVPDIPLPDNDELFRGYVNQLLYDKTSAIMPMGNYGENELEGLDKKIYELLEDEIEKVAGAESEITTAFEFTPSQLGISDTQTKESLGVDSLITGESISEDAVNAVSKLFDFDSEKILNLLLINHPYELYWFDKTAGMTSKYGASIKGAEDSLDISACKVTICFSVANRYAGDEEYTVSGSYSETVQQSVTKAKQIVENYKSENDYTKLQSYLTEICNLVEYNDAAADTGYTGGYGDPWQIIYVFDGNKGTNVVCEGYAKAFQYLCDLTTFTGDVTCYTVTGTMSGGTGAGAHMWNIVTMEDGKNYLVDVTNCDAGSIGNPDKLFLKAPDGGGSVNAGYSFTPSGQNTITYSYDSDQRTLYGDDILTLATTDYNPNSSSGESGGETHPEQSITGSVSITGEEISGETLTVNIGGITSPSTDGTFTYQWYRISEGQETPISGATHSAYTVGSSDVGAAIKVVVKAEGYDGELTAVTNTITKAEQEPLTITTTGQAKVGVGYTLATSGGSINGAVTYQITSGSENAIIEGDELTPLHAGQVTVIATMAGNGSYKDVTSAPVVITIQPGLLDYVGKTASGNIKANTAGSVELPATIVEGSYGTPVASVDSGVITELEIKGNVLNYTGGSSVVGGQTYTVTIPVDNGSDYEKYDIIVTLTGTTKDSPIVEVEDLSVTYTGRPVPISAISGTATFQGAVVDGTWTWADDVPQEIGFGDYNVTFTPTDGNKYAPVTVSVRVAVTKAVPQISLVITNADTDQNVTNGTISLNTGINLSVDVALPDGLTIPATEFASIYYSCGDKNLGNGSLEGAVYAKIEGNEWIPGQTYTVTARFTGISFLEEVTANATLTIASNTEPVPQTFTVTFHANNGTGATSVMTVDQGESLTLPSCSFAAPSGYRFAHWAFNAPGGNPYNAGYNFGQISADAAFYAVWEPIPTPIPTPDPEPSAPSGGGNDDYDDANDDDRDDPNVTTGDNRQPGGGTTTETTARPTVNASNGSANATVSPSMGNTIVDQARSNHSNTVTIAPEISGSVDRTQVTIPNNVVSQLGRETNADLVVSTPVADVTIPNGALSSLAGRGGRVSVTAEMAGNTVTVEVVVGSESVSSVRDGLNVAVPVADATAGTVAVLVHEDGTREVIRKSVAQDGVLTMTLDGSSTIEIVDNSKDFADVPENNWAAEAVAFASGHELFNGTSENTFSPDESMSRGMLAQVLYSLESNPDVIASSAFNDVTGGEWYADAVYWAANQGIVTGYTDGTFGANDSITREQLAVMLYRYAESSGYDTSANADLSVYWDSGNISAYAARAMAWATAEGLISGTTATTLEPGASATRAQVATILMRFCQNVQ